MMPRLFTPCKIFIGAGLLRAVFLIYGLVQDAYAPLPYTDIDYFVFTDAARYVSRSRSPYLRETYRYTPLLAWILVPTAWGGPLMFSFGKILFSLSDLVAGWLVWLVLRRKDSHGETRMGSAKALQFASIWLLNPIVATISTRGSSEGLLAVMTVALLWAILARRVALAGVILGLSVHFKIYPFIYGVSILWYLDDSVVSPGKTKTDPGELSHIKQVTRFANRSRVTFVATSLFTFMALNAIMYHLYSQPFLQHTFLHHLTRIDHRHNFSPYNTLLHLSSAQPSSTSALHLESLAFIPQLALSAFLIPLALAKKDLGGAMLCQTFAFVTFNKVVTSQYFLWYTIFLPFYLPYSSFLSFPRLGLLAATLWIASQGVWLSQAYNLEFLGRSTFYPGLFVSSLAFFAVNCWILGIMIRDVGSQPGDQSRIGSGAEVKTVGTNNKKEKKDI